MDEGEHSLSFQSRYSTGDTSQVSNVTFFVDAVSGSIIDVFPKKTHFRDRGGKATFLLKVEEITSFMAGEIHLSYDPSKIEIVSIMPGSIVEQYNESIFHFDIDNNNGQIDLLMTLLDSNLPSFSGTIDIAKIVFRILSSITNNIIFSQNQIIKNPLNHEIEIIAIN